MPFSPVLWDRLRRWLCMAMVSLALLLLPSVSQCQVRDSREWLLNENIRGTLKKVEDPDHAGQTLDPSQVVLVVQLDGYGNRVTAISRDNNLLTALVSALEMGLPTGGNIETSHEVPYYLAEWSLVQRLPSGVLDAQTIDLDLVKQAFVAAGFNPTIRVDVQNSSIASRNGERLSQAKLQFHSQDEIGQFVVEVNQEDDAKRRSYLVALVLAPILVVAGFVFTIYAIQKLRRKTSREKVNLGLIAKVVFAILMFSTFTIGQILAKISLASVSTFAINLMGFHISPDAISNSCLSCALLLAVSYSPVAWRLSSRSNRYDEVLLHKHGLIMMSDAKFDLATGLFGFLGLLLMINSFSYSMKHQVTLIVLTWGFGLLLLTFKTSIASWFFARNYGAHLCGHIAFADDWTPSPILVRPGFLEALERLCKSSGTTLTRIYELDASANSEGYLPSFLNTILSVRHRASMDLSEDELCASIAYGFAASKYYDPIVRILLYLCGLGYFDYRFHDIASDVLWPVIMVLGHALPVIFDIPAVRAYNVKKTLTMYPNIQAVKALLDKEELIKSSNDKGVQRNIPHWKAFTDRYPELAKQYLNQASPESMPSSP